MSSDAPRVRAGKLAAGVVVAAVVGVVLVAGIGRVAGYADLRAALDGASWGWLAGCVAGQVGVFAGAAGLLRGAVAVGGGPVLPARLALRLAVASFAATQVLAFGGVGGLAITYWALRQVGEGRRDAAVRLIGLNTASYLVFAMLGWAAAAAAMVQQAAPSGMTVPWVVGFPTVVVIARIFTQPARVRRWEFATSRAARVLAIGIGGAAWVRGTLRTDRRLFTWAALYWAGDVVSLAFALRAFGVSISLAPLVAAYTTGYLVQSLPVPLVATGGVDAATTFLLHLLGVPLELALVGVVAHRVFAFWLPVVPGVLAAASLPSSGASLRALALAQPSAVSAAGTGPSSPGWDG